MRIDVLYFEGCPNHRPALDRVHAVLDRLGVKAEVSEVAVTLDDDPAALQFLGSPTVLVDDQDIDPALRQDVTYGFGCRTFNGEGMPPVQIIEDAIRAANDTVADCRQ